MTWLIYNIASEMTQIFIGVILIISIAAIIIAGFYFWIGNKIKSTKVETQTQSTTKKKNPYQLVWYKSTWSKTRTQKNNDKYWQFEIENNWNNIQDKK